MVYCAVQAQHGVLSALQREGLSVSPELPQSLDYGCKIHNSAPRVGGIGIVRGKGTETKAVEVNRARVVVVQDNVFVGLVVPHFGKFLAASAIDFS